METEQWTALLSRIVPQVADDLDDMLGRYDPRRAEPGLDVFPEVSAQLLHQTALKRSDAVAIGFRVSSPLADPADCAARLVAFAAERDAEIIVLAEVDVTGLDRFGFRIERVVGGSPEARRACEAQIRRFWNIDLVF